MRASLLAGVPSHDMNLYHRLRFQAHDPAAWIRVEAGASRPGRTIVILRDIEIPRARAVVRADVIAAPAEFAPEGGLSGDRPIATAQAVVECLRREGVREVVTDRALPFLFADAVQRAGIGLTLDVGMGLRERRTKDADEIAAIRAVQKHTEDAIEMACRTIARADVDARGVLRSGGEPLTAERVGAMIDSFLLVRRCTTSGNIVAQAPHSFDCHHPGEGELRTELPVIVDVFPRSRESLYHGDCTRCVVHGRVGDELSRMHDAVVRSKAAGIAALRAGATGHDVHMETMRVLGERGYTRELPPKDASADYCSMQHGTGHAIGLDIKESPLLEVGGPALVAGDCVTVEPGLYHARLGGIRIEDMLIVTEDGSMNLNSLHEGLSWT
jgi:Xaa-Pro aminopeptidase